MYDALTKDRPDLASQWHPTRNGTRLPEDFTSGSSKRAWWLCPKGSDALPHEWDSVIKSRTLRKGSCPFCSGQRLLSGFNDLQSAFPEIAKEWHPTKNKDLSPSEISKGSGKRVWWRCQNSTDALPHDWETQVVKRTSLGRGCPYCANKKVLRGFNDLSTLMPTLSSSISADSLVSGEDVTLSSGKRPTWVCSKGHYWDAYVYSRSGSTRSGCPACARIVPQAETLLKVGLSDSFNIIEQYPIMRWKVDFLLNDSIILEYDGAYWHSDDISILRDKLKTEKFLSLGYTVIRVRESPLPFLDISSSRLHQLSYEYSVGHPNMSHLVSSITSLDVP